MPISVILTDDHPMVLQGIKACLEESGDVSVTASAHSSAELLAVYAESPSDVVVVDINLPDLNGIDTIARLLEQNPDAKALVFSMHDNAEYARRAVVHGARGYVLKDALPEELLLAIRTVAHGGTFFSPQIATVLATVAPPPSDQNLTARETEVLCALADGKSSKEIAWDMDVSVRTVETHRRNLKQKLGAKSTAECVSIAFSTGLIETEK